MRNLWKGVLALSMISMALGVSAPAQAASGIGPYYATPSWDQTLPAATRFIVLTNMNSEAVLDRETGLVWELSPGTGLRTWNDALNYCTRKTVGNRNGWRLPIIQELASLRDPTVPFPGPALPAGHPFIDVQSFEYRSASTDVTSATRAWLVDFRFGLGTNSKSATGYV